MPPKTRGGKLKGERLSHDGANVAAQALDQTMKVANTNDPVDVQDVSKPAETKEAPLVSAEKPSMKRKKNTEGAISAPPPKARRRSTRGVAKAEPSQEQMLNYLLSKDAEDLCRPEDEANDMKARGKIKTYASSLLNPFEELLCAITLSRPISHRLGLRSIRTVLNEPYSFTGAKAVRAAGREKHHQALWDARTQHKAKTADQIGHMAEVVLDRFTTSDDRDGTQLQKLREDCDRDLVKEADALAESIKGLGKTGLNIFFRRVQGLWDEAFPFVDDRTSASLKKLGYQGDGEEILGLLNKHWNELNTTHLAGDDQEAKRRRAFVLILERAIGADLEGKSDALISTAATKT